MKSYALLSLVLTLLSGVTALAADRYAWVLRWVAFPLLGCAGALALVSGGSALLAGTTESWELILGLPWLHWQLRLDPLAGFFLVIIGIVVIAVSIYGPGYVQVYAHGSQPLGLLGLFTSLFVTGMLLVVLADDAFAFMSAWELMSLSSYFLVVYQHQHAANRRAAFLYLLMAQVSAILILLSFGVLAGFGDGFTFAQMRAAPLTTAWASIAFTLGLIGFGMKAGLVPLHIWLPEAHPVAPSHISALMSGVMIKVAVYGFIRLCFDLIGEVQWQWGVVVLLVASITALYGVLYALVQHDLKRLLAYHSVENIGIIFIGLGLSMIFFGTGHPTLGVLGLIAGLYHTLNHAIFKSLLFLGAGSILQHSHERDLEHMGGLLRRMPWTGLFFLIGCISISALPPFNGFVSEWLTFQTALQAPNLQSGVLRSIIPITAAVLALTGALAAACFVKAYGIAFLGQARSRHVRHAREASLGMLVAQGFLAVLCLLFGVLPTLTITALLNIPQTLMDHSLPDIAAHGWLWLTPVTPGTAAYSAPLVLLGIAAAWGIAFLLLHPRRKRNPIRRGPAWDCGFGPLNRRMQYTSTSFSMPIRRIFAPVWKIDEVIEREPQPELPLNPKRLRFHLQVIDICWAWIYQPIVRLIQVSARQVSRIQTGHLSHYLSYSFVVLIVLLWLIT